MIPPIPPAIEQSLDVPDPARRGEDGIALDVGDYARGSKVDNAAELKEVDGAAAVAPEQAAPVGPSQLIVGTVTITLDAKGGLGVEGPLNVIQALAIIEAGKVYLTMQMQDAMRRSNAAKPSPLLRAGADALAKFARPS